MDLYKAKINIKRIIKMLFGEKIQNYTLDYILLWQKVIKLSDKISVKEIDNLELIGNSVAIEFVNKEVIKDERIYLNNLVEIFKILNGHRRKYNIIIVVNNRKLLKQSKLLRYTKNIDLTIIDGQVVYTKEEYLQEEKQLEDLIKFIKLNNLSPYERFLAAYNIVKQFKKYRDCCENPDLSRKLKYILNNEYMVCVGYANLLKNLLDKLDIPSMYITLGIDNTECDEETDIGRHARNIIKIDDVKYNIHGIYTSDATWDNDMENDLYHHHALTFQRKKELSKLETLEKEDLLLDFNNFDDFNDKINYYLRREINNSHKLKYKDKIIYAYRNLFNDILKILIQIDYSKYHELYNKYKYFLNLDYNNLELINIEKKYSEFLMEYANYIIPLSNNEINNRVTIEALKTVKIKIGGYSKRKYQIWETNAIHVNKKMDKDVFPYVYNPEDSRTHCFESKTLKLIK